MIRPPPRPTLFPYPPLFRSHQLPGKALSRGTQVADGVPLPVPTTPPPKATSVLVADGVPLPVPTTPPPKVHRPQLERSWPLDRKSTRLNSSHQIISYALFCL